MDIPMQSDMEEDVIDLRSDTVTRPTPEMRQAMAGAAVGDDVYRDDPTLNLLQDMAAAKLGKESALFVPSGTMGNLIALLTHCGRGDAAIMGNKSHTFDSEAGGSAALGGVYLLTLPNKKDGTMDLAQIEAAIPPHELWLPWVKLISVENTHNHCGGVVLDAQYMAGVADIARRHDLAVHLDGARIFNAAVALGVEARELAAGADTVMFCISKGLSAPIGSLLCGSADFIERARRTRQMVGGGMRQVGIIAAAGIVALERMIDQLQDDHDNARILGEGIAEIPGLDIDLSLVQTNLVWFDVVRGDTSAHQLSEALAEEGVLVLAMGPRRLRAVTHYGIERKDVEQALQIMGHVLA